MQQATPFSRPDRIFEIKYDGFRSLAYIENGRCTLTSRKGIDYSRFKDLAQAIADEVDAEDAVLDGEIVVLDAEGKPRFYDLMESKGAPVYAAFDLVWLDGEDLREYPLWERKMLLEGSLCQPPERILYVNHAEEQGEELFRQVCQMDLEGIVCKSRLSLYRGKWIKVKNPKYSQVQGRRELFEKRR